MEKWEYKVEYLAHRGGDKMTEDLKKHLWQEDLEKALNKLGADGWEIVNFPNDLFHNHADGYALFKRKK